MKKGGMKGKIDLKGLGTKPITNHSAIKEMKFLYGGGNPLINQSPFIPPNQKINLLI